MKKTHTVLRPKPPAFIPRPKSLTNRDGGITKNLCAAHASLQSISWDIVIVGEMTTETKRSDPRKRSLPHMWQTPSHMHHPSDKILTHTCAVANGPIVHLIREQDGACHDIPRTPIRMSRRTLLCPPPQCAVPLLVECTPSPDSRHAPRWCRWRRWPMISTLKRRVVSYNRRKM